MSLMSLRMHFMRIMKVIMTYDYIENKGLHYH